MFLPSVDMNLTMDKVHMKWGDRDTTIREYFRNLREDHRLFDVTLATDDGKQLQAHKAILCAGSHFFSDILLKSNHANILVYLKGISGTQLEYMLDFMYNRESFIPEKDLEQFLDTGKQMQVKGLQLRFGVLENNEHNDQNSIVDEVVANQEGSFDTVEIVPGSVSMDLSEAKVETQNVTKNVLDIQI